MIWKKKSVDTRVERRVRGGSEMEKHNLIILITFFLGCLVIIQALQLNEPDEGLQTPVWKTGIFLRHISGIRNKVPEEYRVPLTLRGRLGVAGFPDIVETKYHDDVVSIAINHKDVLVFDVLDPDSGYVTTRYYLFSEEFGLHVIPMDEETEIGGVNVYEAYEAELIEVEGYAFDIIARTGTRYTLLNVNKVEFEGFQESRTEPAWIMASKLLVAVASETQVVNITSLDLNRLPGLACAINIVFEEEFIEEQGIITSSPDRLRKIPRAQGIAIILFFQGKMTPEKTTYGFFVRYAGDIYSIYIQFTEQIWVTS